MENRFVIGDRRWDLTIVGLPKISLNKWYAGIHWTKRSQMKNTYKDVIGPIIGEKLPDDQYIVEYYFGFRTRPLDASNCASMIKLIEDQVFENDKWDRITIGTVKSYRAEENFVKVKIYRL